MPQPWWMTDVYNHDRPIPAQFEDYAGPQGVALVRAWSNGKTDPGWGLRKESDPEQSGFIRQYARGAFQPVPVLTSVSMGKCNFAFVMRSMKLVCIDIDGKNGGLLHAGKLGMLPLTLAETSKSGDGYHLFYATSEDRWDPEKGYAQFTDRIGLEQGVDLRATGCVYHHSVQRWNGRFIAELPQHLKDRLTNHVQRSAAQVDAIIKILDSGDQEEVLVMQDSLLDDLKRPIPRGRRNTTLFAIGTKMKLANVPGWEDALFDRATDVGLDRSEATKLVGNVRKYGS